MNVTARNYDLYFLPFVIHCSARKVIHASPSPTPYTVIFICSNVSIQLVLPGDGTLLLISTSESVFCVHFLAAVLDSMQCSMNLEHDELKETMKPMRPKWQVAKKMTKCSSE